MNLTSGDAGAPRRDGRSVPFRVAIITIVVVALIRSSSTDRWRSSRASSSTGKATRPGSTAWAEAARSSNRTRRSPSSARCSGSCRSAPGRSPRALDGKVIAISDREGARTFLVRFTGIGWDLQERIEALARGDKPA